MIEESVIQFLDMPGMVNSNPRPEADTQDVLDFKSALKGDGASSITIVGDENPGVNRVKETGGSISGEIMDRLDNVRESARRQQEEITVMMEKAATQELDINEMMQMQVAMYRLNYQLELTSKISSGAKDGLETLYKNQG